MAAGTEELSYGGNERAMYNRRPYRVEEIKQINLFTLAPRCSKSSHIPRPIPEAPPVTNATQPEIFITFFQLLSFFIVESNSSLRLGPIVLRSLDHIPDGEIALRVTGNVTDCVICVRTT